MLSVSSLRVGTPMAAHCGLGARVYWSAAMVVHSADDPERLLTSDIEPKVLGGMLQIFIESTAALHVAPRPAVFRVGRSTHAVCSDRSPQQLAVHLVGESV